MYCTKLALHILIDITGAGSQHIRDVDTQDNAIHANTGGDQAGDVHRADDLHHADNQGQDCPHPDDLDYCL